MRRRITAAGLLFMIALTGESCHRDQSMKDARITASNELTERFSKSRLAQWHVRANAAGSGCDVLLIETPVIMADAMVEAVHYGSGAYAVYEHGVQQFYRDHSFRGVAYRDSTARIWTYGRVTEAEAEAIAPCR